MPHLYYSKSFVVLYPHRPQLPRFYKGTRFPCCNLVASADGAAESVPARHRKRLVRELAAWWELTVPPEYRTVGTVANAAEVLARVRNPVALVEHWRATGDYRPWLAYRRAYAPAGTPAGRERAPIDPAGRNTGA